MKREGQRRAEYFAALVEKVKEIPVAVVVGTVIQIYDRNRNPVQEKDLATLGSGNYLALCPFHADLLYGEHRLERDPFRDDVFRTGFQGRGLPPCQKVLPHNRGGV